MKLSSALIIFFLALLFPIAVFGQVIKAWDAHYDSPYGDDRGDHDWAYDIAVDDFGNSYVTGWSAGMWYSSTWEHDFLTIKYDPQGNEVWVGRYGGTEHDGAYAMAIDREANVYVTGFMENYWLDYLTVKYDTDGNELWAATWQGQTDNDEAFAITVDDFGNVYVTGSSSSFGTHADYLTIKYDTNGTELWVARYDGPGGIDVDIPSDIAVDSYGNVYVTGKSMGIGTAYDYMTIKYDADGNELWSARYNGAYDQSDEAISVTVDISGNVYVAGSSKVNNTLNYATVKYDVDGNELWSAYSGFGGEISALGLNEPAGRIYVTGLRYANARDYATIAYDEGGNELWRAFYDAAGQRDEANDIVVDIDGSVVVTGWSSLGEWYYYKDILTVKYDANGNELWTQRYNGADWEDEANAMALDRQGNVYVAGWSDMVYSNVFTTIKYMPTVSLGLTGITPVVAQGGTVKYEVSIANNTPESQDVWAWIKEKLPTGEWAEDYLLPPTSLNLVPDQEGIYTLRTPIPLSALLGPHEYWGYIGADTLAVWDCDMFPFSVYFQRHNRQVKDQ